MVHVPENTQNTLVPYSTYNSPVHTKSDDSFVTILANSELHCATPHTPSYKYTQLPSPSPHTLNTLSQGKHPTHSVTKYLLIYLLVCMFAYSCCIVIGAFVSSRGGQICKSTPGGGARSQFRELSPPFRRISTASSLDPFDA
jgi:hypothetical protein